MWCQGKVIKPKHKLAKPTGQLNVCGYMLYIGG